MFADRRLSMRLAPIVLLLASSCARFLDVMVTNPCDQDATVVFWTFAEPPAPERAREALSQWKSQDNAVPANAESFVLRNEITGVLPFEDGYGIIRWKGEENYALFRLRPTNVEPVPVLIPERLCP